MKLVALIILLTAVALLSAVWQSRPEPLHVALDDRPIAVEIS